MLAEKFEAKQNLTCYDTHVTIENLSHEMRVNGLAIDGAVAAQ